MSKKIKEPKKPLVLSVAPDSELTMAMLHKAKAIMEENGKQCNEIIVDFVEPLKKKVNPLLNWSKDA